MEVQMKTVSTAALGQLRPPNQADIERSMAAAARSPAQQKVYAERMAQLEKTARQFVAMKQQGTQAPVSQQSKAVSRAEPIKAPPRHQTVTTAGYGDKVAPGARGRARTPEHVAIQRSIQSHIQRNVQRESRNARFREVGQQIKAKAAGMMQQVGRAAKTVTQTLPSSPSRSQSELAAAQKMQSMVKHREKTVEKETGKTKGKDIAPGLQPTPTRQPQKQKGKEPERGPSR